MHFRKKSRCFDTWHLARGLKQRTSLLSPSACSSMFTPFPGCWWLRRASASFSKADLAYLRLVDPSIRRDAFQQQQRIFFWTNPMNFFYPCADEWTVWVHWNMSSEFDCSFSEQWFSAEPASTRQPWCTGFDRLYKLTVEHDLLHLSPNWVWYNLFFHINQKDSKIFCLTFHLSLIITVLSCRSSIQELEEILDRW